MGRKTTFEKLQRTVLNANGIEKFIAQHQLGDCYFCGINVKKDLKEAAKWHALARSNGYKYHAFLESGKEIDPTVTELEAVYEQMDGWWILHEFSYFYECYAGAGDDYDTKGKTSYPLLDSVNHSLVKAIHLKNGQFYGIRLAFIPHKCGRPLEADLYVDGKIEGEHCYHQFCERMDGPEDYSYSDSYFLSKKA